MATEPRDFIFFPLYDTSGSMSSVELSQMSDALKASDARGPIILGGAPGDGTALVKFMMTDGYKHDVRPKLEFYEPQQIVHTYSRKRKKKTMRKNRK